VSKTGTGILAATLVVCLPVAVLPQSSKGSISASYVFLHDSDRDETYSLGGSLTGTCRIHGWLAGTAEVSMSTRHEDFSATGGGTYDSRYQSVQAGPRLSPPGRRFRPYVEVLAGATRHGIWERSLDQIGEWSSPEFSLQPGVGLDILFTRRVALRVGGDLRLLFKQDSRFDTGYRARLYRLQVGLALQLGVQQP
jgi:hypothetical protein